MAKFSATVLLLVCFSAALISTQAADLPFTKFCGEQQATCTDTCGDKIKEFVCNEVTGITTTPCTCEDGETSETVDPPSIPLPPSTDGLEGVAAPDAPADDATTTAEPTAEATPESGASTASPTPAAPASSAARAAGSVVALGFVAAAMLF